MPSWRPDWLAATVAAGDGDKQKWAVRRVAQLFAPLGEEWETATGHHGYTRAAVMKAWPGVRMQWAGTPQQGVHLTVSGKPLAALASLLPAVPGRWAALSHLNVGLAELPHPVAYRRVDIALDSDKLGPSGAIFQKATGGMVTRLAKEGERSQVRPAGSTYTLGNREGGVFVRFYDKAAEQAQGNKVLMEALRPWFRMELEYHAERAGRVMDAYADHGIPGVMACVDAVVSFRNKEDAPNPSRRSLQDWWASYLGQTEDVPRRPPKPPRDADLDARLMWARQAVGAILMELHDGRGRAELSEWVQDTVTAARTARPLHGPHHVAGIENTLTAGD